MEFVLNIAVRIVRPRGVDVDDSAQALRRYADDRATWKPRLRHLAHVTLYRWPDDPRPPEDEGDVPI